jgi:hypothetical protein
MSKLDTVRQVSLWGEDHIEFGEIAVTSLGGSVAIAISKGKHPKGYPTLDSNEDAVLAATCGESTALAVVDGHWGLDAARAALRGVAEDVEHLLSSRHDPGVRIAAALTRARDEVRRVIALAKPERTASKTTLAVVVIESGVVTVGGFGDSDVKALEPGRSKSLWKAAPFLGPDTDLDDAWHGGASLRNQTWIVAGTDGVFDFLGRDWASKLESLSTYPPSDFARAAIEASFEGGAGDHTALAVVRLSLVQS